MATRAQIEWFNKLALLLEEEPESAVDHVEKGQAVLKALLASDLAASVEQSVIRARLWARDGQGATAFLAERGKTAAVLQDAAVEVFDTALEADGFEDVLEFLATLATEQEWNALHDRFDLLARLHEPAQRKAAVDEVKERLRTSRLPYHMDQEELARHACLACIRGDELGLAAQFLPTLQANRDSWNEWKHTEPFERLLASPEGRAASTTKKKR